MIALHHSVIFMVSLILGFIIGYFTGKDNAAKIERNIEKLKDKFRRKS